jgi:type I restriction enzyme S subunit
MSRIDDLIRQHCPNGVSFQALWELTSWDKRFNAVDSCKQPRVLKYHYLLASEMTSLISEGGDVKLLTTNTSNLWTTEELSSDWISDAEIICIPWGGNPNVQYFRGRFVTSDNRIAVVNDPSSLDTRFLYFFLLSQIDLISTFYRGSGIAHPSMSKVLDMRIPVPPLEVQQEIVRVLDNFRELEAELEAELKARREQYAHYRREILNYGTGRSDVQFLKLAEVANFTNAKAHERVVDPEGEIALLTARFISTQGRQARYVKRADVRTPAVRNQTALVMSDLPNGRALARAFFIDEDEKYAANQRVCLVDPIDETKVSPRFLYYILDRNQQLLRYDSGFDQTHLSKDQILGIRIPVPAMSEQLRAVAILDKFDALVNDIAVGLPAELNARRRQYEYYRDRLLSFGAVA